MGSNKDFHEILRDKIAALNQQNDEKFSDSASSNNLYSAYTDPLESFSIHSQSVKFKRQNRSPYKSQHSARAKKPKATSQAQTEHAQKPSRPQESSVAVTQEPTLTVNKLSVAAIITLELLSIDTQNPATRITASRVKSAFRKKAMTLHPDLNPGLKATRFSELKEAVDLVLKEIKSQV